MTLAHFAYKPFTKQTISIFIILAISSCNVCGMKPKCLVRETKMFDTSNRNV